MDIVADIGGTYIRITALDAEGRPNEPKVYRCTAFPGPAEALRAFADEHGRTDRIERAALAVAAPITTDLVSMTNHPWRFSQVALRDALGLRALRVVNDFAANALAVEALSDQDIAWLRRGEPDPAAPVAVLGPGTGLGVALLVPATGGNLVVATEGGHATQAAADDEDEAVLRRLRRRFDHVSAERVLSGPGILALHWAINGIDDPALSPEQVSQAAMAEPDGPEAAVLARFMAMLGTFAGNLALSSGARGGVVMLGGILPRMLPLLRASAFLDRFADKGRFRDYLEAVPVAVVTRDLPALVGLARLLRSGEKA